MTSLEYCVIDESCKTCNFQSVSYLVYLFAFKEFHVRHRQNILWTELCSYNDVEII